MSDDINRRSTLKLLGAAAGTLSLSGIAASRTRTNGSHFADVSDDQITEWRRTYDFGGNDVATDVVHTSGGYVFAGSTATESSGSDAYLAAVNDAGEVQWRTTFDGDGVQKIHGLLKASVGYILCGEGDSGGVVIKADDEGTEQWRTNLGTEIADITQSINGGYAVVGLQMDSDADVYPMLAKLTMDGDVEWTKNYRTDVGPSYFNAVVATRDAGYALAGYLDLNGNWTVKTDSEGNEEWSTAPREGEAEDVYLTADGDILSTGSVVGSGGFSPYLTRYALDGTVRFTTQYDAIDADSASAVTELTNDDFVLSTDEFGLLQTDSEGVKQRFEDYDGEAHALVSLYDESVVIAGTTGGDDADAVLAKTRTLVDSGSEDGDDQRQNATEIESGEQVTDTLTGTYDQDWYTFPVEQGETVSIDWSLTSPEDATLNYDYRLRTPSGESTGDVEEYAGEPGQYYIYIRPDDADIAPDPEEHQYQFTVTVASQTDGDDGTEGGDESNGSDGSDGSDGDGGVDVDEDEC
ncbi:hypothetical protein SAMN04487950_0949 [Halogranum rubrum]|uniref:PQQ-like domain-containing protein n=1 Tax=Halogranum rubrum TaxID=553466 RepID=A0A1I4C5I1_9EURY|nr:hypothetical protein [Halogranum rubrum]SFK75880.1 hypothetical protein SAMN04487950_0949 [Halogranum rubrum]